MVLFSKSSDVQTIASNVFFMVAALFIFVSLLLVIVISILKIKLLSINGAVYIDDEQISPSSIDSIEKKKLGNGNFTIDGIELGVKEDEIINFYRVAERSSRLSGGSKTLDMLFARFPELKDKLIIK